MGPLRAEGQIHRDRLYYLDWLRVLAVLGVFYAHTADIFDTLFWHTRRDGQGTDWNALATFGAQWGMSLFFLLAGASAWFALSHRTSNQFISERFKRLLIPFTVAFILLSPIQAYYMVYFTERAYSLYHGNLLQFFPYFFTNIHVGWDLKWLAIYGYHLWFLAFLYIISMLALPLLLYLKGERGLRFISRLAALCNRPAGLFVFALPIALIKIMLWAPFPGYQGWSDFFFWFLIFVCGFILVADSRFEAAIQKQGKIALLIGVIGVLSMLFTNFTGVLSSWDNAISYSAGYMLYQLLFSITSWSMTVAVLYIFQRFLNFSNKVVHYTNEAVLPFYILHQPVIVLIAFYVLPWNLAPEVKFLVVSTAAIIVTFVLYELLIRRIKVLRWLFGMKTSQPLLPAHSLPS
jgi:peptidoglycan/LPS O-acetylase OafA/YrhL